LTTIQSQRENVDSLRASLLHLLDGMNYCLDWKADDPDWSPREIVYHLLDTPSGGTAALIRKIISGEISEYEIWSDRSNVTEERSTMDLEEIESDIAAFFGSFATALEAADDDDLQRRSVVMHQRTRGEDVERTLEEVLAGIDRHWRAHLEQLAEVREALGF
jgi:preprotein translocase subunit SecA